MGLSQECDRCYGQWTFPGRRRRPKDLAPFVHHSRNKSPAVRGEEGQVMRR